jgi:hypothetical protein
MSSNYKKDIFVWDKYSDQPFPIKDKLYKKQMRLKYIFDYLPLLFVNLIVFPVALVLMRFFRQKPKNIEDFFGMSVNLDKGKYQNELIDELGIGHILIRVPLSDIDNINSYLLFAKSFKNSTILINILQDREHIENRSLLKRDIRTIFNTFAGTSNKFQIGNVTNRTKWGFFSIFEYLRFYKTVMQIRDDEFADIKLIGVSVIDFEYHHIVAALFNFHKIRFDKVSSLLYVDRRGAPENRQMFIFDLTKKIDFLFSLVYLSPKSDNSVVITEVNWPLKGTAPYAPTSEFECVSEDDYANYLIRYYILALATNKIETLYWHQLVSSGYGLLDVREEKPRKTKAFFALKSLLVLLKNEKFISLEVTKNIYRAKFSRLDILWINGDKQVLINRKYDKILSLENRVIETDKITQEPIFCIKE